MASLPADDVLALKAMFRELVRLSGGQKVAGHIIGVDQALIGRWGNVNEEAMPRCDAVLALETRLEEAVLTRWAADQLGFVLVPKAEAGPPGDLQRHIVNVAGESADPIGGASAGLRPETPLRAIVDSQPPDRIAQEARELGAVAAAVERDANVVTLHRRGG